MYQENSSSYFSLPNIDHTSEDLKTIHSAEIGDRLTKNRRLSITNELVHALRVEPIFCWLRCWFQPPGIFLVVLGPDGVGKSTTIKRLIEMTGSAFSKTRVYHWRPMFVFPPRHPTTVTDPHARPPRSGSSSMARLLAYVLDYWFGYWWKIRVLMAQSGLVVFDRYYDDLLVDPRRYRYGGPLWLPQLLTPLIPKPDLVFVLDAPNSVIASRKRELAVEEIQRQRQCYVRLAETVAGAHVVCTDQDIAQTMEQFCQAIATHLLQRLKRPLASAHAPTAASSIDTKGGVSIPS